MVSKCARISVRLVFCQDYGYEEEFMAMLELTKMFSVACAEDEYHSSITRIILADADPSEYILIHETLLEGMNPPVLFVSAEMVDTLDTPFVYTSETSEAEFLAQAKAIVERVKIKCVSISRENSGFSFYKKYLLNSKQKEELAAAHFLLSEYQSALACYISIKKTYPSYASRMAGWCSLLLNTPGGSGNGCYDILLLNKRADILYGMCMKLAPETRMGVEYWLSKNPLPPGASFLIDYRCYRGFLGRNDPARTTQCLERMRAKIGLKMSKAKTANNIFWEEILGKLEDVFLTK